MVYSAYFEQKKNQQKQQIKTELYHTSNHEHSHATYSNGKKKQNSIQKILIISQVRWMCITSRKNTLNSGEGNRAG
jgi:hypothetical protein